MMRHIGPILVCSPLLIAALALGAAASCRSDSGRLTVSIAPNQIPADGRSTARVTINLEGYEGAITLSTSRGTFQDSGAERTVITMVGGQATVALVACDGATDPNCEGNASIVAQADLEFGYGIATIGSGGGSGGNADGGGSFDGGGGGRDGGGGGNPSTCAGLRTDDVLFHGENGPAFRGKHIIIPASDPTVFCAGFPEGPDVWLRHVDPHGSGLWYFNPGSLDILIYEPDDFNTGLGDVFQYPNTPEANDTRITGPGCDTLIKPLFDALHPGRFHIVCDTQVHFKMSRSGSYQAVNLPSGLTAVRTDLRDGKMLLTGGGAFHLFDIFTGAVTRDVALTRGNFQVRSVSSGFLISDWYDDGYLVAADRGKGGLRRLTSSGAVEVGGYVNTTTLGPELSFSDWWYAINEDGDAFRLAVSSNGDRKVVRFRPDGASWDIVLSQEQVRTTTNMTDFDLLSILY